LQTFFQKEAGLYIAKSEKIQLRIETIGKISKEAELRRIIETYESKDAIIEEIQYKKATGKFEKIIQAYDKYASRGAPTVPFDVEKTLTNISTGATEESESVMQVQIGVKRLLSNCWEGKTLGTNEKEQILELTKDQKGRRIFADALNNYRKTGQFSMKEKGYPLVSELVYYVLNQAQVNEDIDFALTILVLGQTLYLDRKNPSGGSEKIFLTSGIQKHPFWTTQDFWRKAIVSSINEEMKTQQLQGISQEEKDMIERNITFGKLTALAHNMVQFSIDKTEIENVILTFAKEKGLPEPFIEALKVY